MSDEQPIRRFYIAMPGEAEREVSRDEWISERRRLGRRARRAAEPPADNGAELRDEPFHIRVTHECAAVDVDHDAEFR